MLDAVDKASAFVTGFNEDTLREDDRTIFALVKCIEIIG